MRKARRAKRERERDLGLILSASNQQLAGCRLDGGRTCQHDQQQICPHGALNGATGFLPHAPQDDRSPRFTATVVPLAATFCFFAGAALTAATEAAAAADWVATAPREMPSSLRTRLLKIAFQYPGT